jgi:hypothetical protein
VAETYYLTGFASDLTGGANFSNQYRSRANGVYTISVPVTGGQTETDYAWTIPGTPGSASWGSTQTWYVYVDVTTSINKTYLECTLRRVNASGTVQETKTSTQGEQDIAVAGLFTFTFSSISWSSGNVGDRIRVDFAIRNANHGDETVTIDAGDSYITADMTATPRYNVFSVSGAESQHSVSEVTSYGGTPTATTSDKHHGDACWEVNPLTTGTEYIGLGQWLPGDQGLTSEAKVATGSCQFKSVTEPSSNSEPIITMALTGTTTDPEIRIGSDRKISLYKGTTLVEQGTTVLTDETWYRISFFVQTQGNSGTAASYDVSIDGVSELSGTADWGGTGYFSGVYFGKFTNRNSQGYTARFDDIIIADEYVPPDGVVSVMQPNADGSFINWTASAGNRWECVVEIPYNTTDYIYTTSDTYNQVALESASNAGVSGTIYAVQSVAMMAEASGSAATARVGVKTASLNWDPDGAADLSTTYAPLGWVLELNPHNDTAFTTTDLDSIELAVDNTTGSEEGRCTQQLLHVYHEESASLSRAANDATSTGTALKPTATGSSAASATADIGTSTASGLKPTASGSGAVTVTCKIATSTANGLTAGVAPSSAAPATATIATSAADGLKPAAAGSGVATATAKIATSTGNGLKPTATGSSPVTATAEIATSTGTALAARVPVPAKIATSTGNGLKPSASPSSAAPAPAEIATSAANGLKPTAAGSSPVAVTCKIATSTANGLAPTAAPSGSAPATAGVAASLANGLKPTAAGSGVATAIAKVGTSTANGLKPTALSDDQFADAEIATSTANGLKPTASGSSAVTVTCKIATSTGNGLKPTASPTGSAPATAKAATSTGNGLKPTPAAAGAAPATAKVATTTGNGLKPTPTGVGVVIVTADIATSVGNGVKPTASGSGSVTVTCDIGTSTANGLKPGGAGSGAATITATIATSTGTALKPTATGSGAVTVTCDIGTTTANGLKPTATQPAENAGRRTANADFLVVELQDPDNDPTWQDRATMCGCYAGVQPAELQVPDVKLFPEEMGLRWGASR